jgi:hypothetical protein
MILGVLVLLGGQEVGALLESARNVLVEKQFFGRVGAVLHTSLSDEEKRVLVEELEVERFYGLPD